MTPDWGRCEPSRRGAACCARPPAAAGGPSGGRNPVTSQPRLAMDHTPLLAAQEAARVVGEDAVERCCRYAGLEEARAERAE